jgi:hypothetical protein
MLISDEGKIGIALALLGLGGGGALFVLPHPYADYVGWSLIGVSVLGLILLGLHHFKVRIGGLLWRGGRQMWPQYLMVFAGCLFFVGLVGFLQLNVAPLKETGEHKDETQPHSKPVASSASPKNPEPAITESKATPQPSSIRKYIFEGLMKTREDLLQIKKEDLSCEALNAWQTRADAATRLAHANGIGIHNPISQYLGACQKITDVELLEAIRMSIVQLLNQGIQTAGG